MKESFVGFKDLHQEMTGDASYNLNYPGKVERAWARL